MNYSTAVFLINNKVRAISVAYEVDVNGRQASRTMYKTLDPTIAVDDLVVVPTDTRHKRTVCKVVEVDVDVNFDSNAQMNWIVQRLDQTAYEQTLAQEKTAIDTIKSAETRKKRDELREAIFKDQDEKLKALAITSLNGDAPPA